MIARTSCVFDDAVGGRYQTTVSVTSGQVLAGREKTKHVDTWMREGMMGISVTFAVSRPYGISDM